MKRILFVGEHPISTSGNGGMMHSVLSSVDSGKYEITCFALESTPVDPALLVSRPMPFSIINSTQPGDPQGHEKLLHTIQRGELDAIVMVGIDSWQFWQIMPRLNEIIKSRGIKWASIFPYDLQMVRKDWVNWINMFTHPCVYSQYGYNLLKDHVPNIRYFRPPLQASSSWRKYEEKERIEDRRTYFPYITDKTFVFGFVGANQVRKDPQKALKAFSIVKKKLKDQDVRLYLHTTLDGYYNLQQYAVDCGIKQSELLAKQPKTFSTIKGMVTIYNSIDCLVNCSLQEGLSWTLLEAMLCGTPFIATNTTAQKELLDVAGFSVPCEELTYMPLVGERGSTWTEAKSCRAEDLAEAMVAMVVSDKLRTTLSEEGLEEGKKWLEGVSNINDLLDEVCTKKVVEVKPVIDAVLFAQHSSAGDVLMTTQCFKGIKEKHPNLPLIYMTSEQFMNVVEGNPYIDKIIPWDETKLRRNYKVVYNPHGEKILKGRFNTLNTKLYEMYPYFCKVEADTINIMVQDVSNDLVEQVKSFGKFIVVHTTGGAQSRVYKHMDIAVSGIEGYKIVQIGGATDLTSHKADYDLRGKLTWRENAFVMSMADAAVVIDSYPAHLAGAVHTPAVVLFGPAPARVTGPRSDIAEIICLEPNHLDVCPQMGFCYGGECPSPCINTISPLKVKKALLSLLSKERVTQSFFMKEAIE